MPSANYPKLIFISMLSLVTVMLAFAQELTSLLNLSIEMTFLLLISGIYLILAGGLSVYKAKRERFERTENKFLMAIGIAQLLVGIAMFAFFVFGLAAIDIATNLKLLGAGIATLTLFGTILWGVWEYGWR